MSDPRTFTPAENIVEPYTDGSGWKVVAEAGKPIPWDRVEQLGILDAEGKPRIKGMIQEPEAPALNEADLATLQGVDVRPGDLAADLASPGSIRGAKPRLEPLPPGEPPSIAVTGKSPKG